MAVRGAHEGEEVIEVRVGGPAGAALADADAPVGGLGLDLLVELGDRVAQLGRIEAGSEEDVPDGGDRAEREEILAGAARARRGAPARFGVEARLAALDHGGTLATARGGAKKSAERRGRRGRRAPSLARGGGISLELRPMRRLQILVCDGPSCGLTYESDRLSALLRARVAGDPGLRGRIHVVAYNCFGRCSEGPNMFVRALAPGEDGEAEPREIRGRGFYPGMDEAKVVEVLRRHADEGTPVEAWVDDY